MHYFNFFLIIYIQFDDWVLCRIYKKKQHAEASGGDVCTTHLQTCSHQNQKLPAAAKNDTGGNLIFTQQKYRGG